MGESKPKMSPVQSYAKQMQDFTKVLPEYMQTTASQILPYEQALFQAQQQVLPQYTEAQMQLARDYAPAAAELQDAIDAAHAARVSQADVALARGAGGDMVKSLDELNQQLNPQLYAGLKAYGDLIKSYDLSKGVSGSESANVERNLNRMNEGMGQTRVPTSTGAITNALAFDDRLQAKKSALSSVLSMLPQMQSGINPLLATTRSTTPANTNFIGYSTPQIGSFGQQAASQQASQMANAGNARTQAMSQKYTTEMARYKDLWDVGQQQPILGLLS